MARRRSRYRSRADALSRRAFQVALGLTILVCVPAVILVSLTSKIDLFDLTPRMRYVDGHVLLAWPVLERAKRALNAAGIGSGTKVRALGYMMTEDSRPVRDGDLVENFILLPDAGNALHPAHRFGDQMIAVRLRPGAGIRFFERRLIWAFGTLRGLPGDPAGSKPLYLLEDARVDPAEESDIPKFFR